METYYPYQYPFPWSIDPQTQLLLSQRPEKYYGILFKFSQNPLLDSKRLSTELQRFDCWLLTSSWIPESSLSDFSQLIVACHFGILDSSIPLPIASWILGAYAGLNRPLFVLNRINATPDIPYGAFRPSLNISYETNEDIFKQLLPYLPTFFRNITKLNDFQTSIKRFLEYSLSKLSRDQLAILKYILLVDRNPYLEEEIIDPLRNYSEHYLDIYLSDWSEFMVTLGLLQKKTNHPLLWRCGNPLLLFRPPSPPFTRNSLFTTLPRPL
jgi:hypothetical protein